MPALSQTPAASGRATAAGDASPSLVLAIVCAGVVLASLDLFIVNVALPQIGPDFARAGLADLSWVLNGYAIVYASLLVLFGRLAERYRRERGFLLGVAVFVAASAACAAATSLAMLVAFRVVQAAGAALLTPTSLGLILATFPPERRHGAVRAWTAVGGIAAALGPVVGGAARGRELALGVPRQRADRVARARRRVAAAARRPRPSAPAPRRARRAAGHGRRRLAHARAGQGRRVGLGRRTDGRRARRSRVVAARRCSRCTPRATATR